MPRQTRPHTNQTNSRTSPAFCVMLPTHRTDVLTPAGGQLNIRLGRGAFFISGISKYTKRTEEEEDEGEEDE